MSLSGKPSRQVKTDFRLSFETGEVALVLEKSGDDSGVESYKQ